ncbi:hypothetical protein ACR1PO_18190 [Chryseobacterium sp. RRHN12]|uniref:hypothetical protein n=1 Tax=Chryseobacterium sp. RRHN12 TaxID=3437884 RepID=UPI003D9B5184
MKKLLMDNLTAKPFLSEIFICSQTATGNLPASSAYHKKIKVVLHHKQRYHAQQAKLIYNNKWNALRIKQFQYRIN